MKRRQSGFTIVELVVVIAVIGILAGITIVGYGNWRQRATENTLKNDLNGASSAMDSSRNFGSDYPATIPSTFSPSDNVSMTVKSGGGVFCLEATSSEAPGVTYSVKSTIKTQVAKPCGTYFTKIAVTGSTSCGISYGKAYCWGNGSVYQLGNASTSNSLTPVAVNTALMSGKVTDISGSCAVANGKAYCWGSNSAGQVGNGTVVNAPTPVAVNTSVMTGTVTAISAGGGGHTCAIADGKVYCWGQNNAGQLGNNTITSSLYPVAVDMSGVSGKFTAISTSIQYTCGIAGGKAYCWGQGSYSPTANGHLGNGTTLSYKVPTAVTTSLMSGTVTDISTSPSAFTCAVADNRAYCWGEGSGGQLGNSTMSTSTVPVAVTTSVMSGKVTQITNGCAVADNKAYCWGANSGRFGDGTSTASSSPVATSTSLMSDNVDDITSGGSAASSSCATANGNAYCWGLASSGQLGNGTTVTSLVPVLVSQIP